MKTQELFKLLEEQKEKSLIFEYAPNEFIGANYHITEVKHTSIDSVDCGSATDSWSETIIQLWESPTEIGKTKYMTALKALGILKKVGTLKPYDLESEVKFEYGNSYFHTAQLFVNDFEIIDNKLIVKLEVEKTDCKAKTICGVEEQEKEIVLNEEPCCTPNGNCC